MAKADIWMPFYVADYLADTMHLSAAEHGGYLMLILHYWKSGPIPDDDARLAIISRMGDAWGNASSTIKAFFEQRNGMLVHSRIDREKAEANSNKDKNQARAKAAAEKRWGKNASSNAPSMPQALPGECPSPSPTPSPKGDKKNIGAGAPGVVLEQRQDVLDAIEAALPKDGEEPTKVPKFDPKAALLAEGVPDQLVADYLQVRKAKKAAFTQTALDGLKREAAKAGYTVEQAVAKCCERGWQGFNAEWVAGQKGATGGKFQVNGADHSSSIAAMEASRVRMGVPTDFGPDEDLSFDNFKGQ